jgi:two-component system, OmpR family, response regulator
VGYDRIQEPQRIQPASRLLIVEDDRALRELLERVFAEAGYAVDTAPDGQAGLHRALTEPYDAFVIDRGLPAIDGFDLTRRLRRQGLSSPILILTAYGSTADIVEGLDSGAEDYLTKPFEVDVLLARVRALIRRQHSARTTLPIGSVLLDLTKRTALMPNGREIELSGRECALLRVLAESPNRVFSRNALRDRVFDSAESESIVDTYVHYVRRKLGKGAIRTVRGHGYKIGQM